MNNTAYLLALHSINGLGPIRLKRLIDHFSDPKLAWEASSADLESLGILKEIVDLLLKTRQTLDPEVYAKSIEDQGIKFVTIFDESYPKLLAQIYDPPVVLYYKGEILPKDDNSIAVVGSRKMTGYGRVVTETFASQLSYNGLTIVSGLARGVDTQAHIAALEAKGRTLAVLGGGLNRIFPLENVSLFKKIIEGYGAVLSEFTPDTPSWAINFPIRNRIIVGLSRAVLVTEAARDSGSLITAHLANDIGRDVFAVPGPITSALSEGCANLIKEGAKLVFKPQDILSEFGIESVKARSQDLNEFSIEEKRVLEVLQNESMHIDEICRKVALATSIVSAVLLKMEITGFVQNLGSGTYCVTKE